MHCKGGAPILTQNHITKSKQFHYADLDMKCFCIDCKDMV